MNVLALNLADEQLGIAWLIAAQSPQVSGAQLKWFSRIEAKRDTMGTVGRKGSRTKTRDRLELDTALADDSDHVESADRNDLAHAIAAQLGDFGAALLQMGSVDAAADAAGLSRATAYRRIADARRMFAGSI